MAAPKLTAKTARNLLAADLDVQRLKDRLEKAEKARSELRDKHRARIPLSTDAAERKKQVRVLEVGGIRIRVTPANSGESFSLKRYTEAGHKVTKAMRDAISPGKDFDRWTVRRQSE